MKERFREWFWIQTRTNQEIKRSSTQSTVIGKVEQISSESTCLARWYDYREHSQG